MMSQSMRLPPLSVLAPVVAGVIAQCDALGFNVRSRFVPLVAMAQMAEGENVLPSFRRALEEFLNPSREDVIVELYARLAELAEFVDRDQLAAAEYDSVLAKLRDLQVEEADALRESLMTARALDAEELEESLRAASDLLDRHDHDPS